MSADIDVIWEWLHFTEGTQYISFIPIIDNLRFEKDHGFGEAKREHFNY